MILDVSCNDFGFILNILGYVFGVLQWVIPILLIVLITVDVVKSMLASDEKKTKEAISKAGKRFMYAIILFLIPFFIKYLFRTIGSVGRVSNTTNWISCFNTYFK